MKKTALLLIGTVLGLWGCGRCGETELTGTNVRYDMWSAEKLFALLPEEGKMAVCDFNAAPKVLDSLTSSYSECTSRIMTYRGKCGYILKDNASQCQSIGRSDDLVYYRKSGEPVLHLVSRYLPAADLTMQTLVLFEDGKYSNAFSRSTHGQDAAALENEEFSVYRPILGEERVENYSL